MDLSHIYFGFICVRRWFGASVCGKLCFARQILQYEEKIVDWISILLLQKGLIFVFHTKQQSWFGNLLVLLENIITSKWYGVGEVANSNGSNHTQMGL